MSWLNRRGQLLVEAPHALTVVLVVLNVAAYALCFRQSGSEAIASDILFRNGAMYAHALERGEYWRLIAYGFLHVNGIHLAGNMLCLVLWGGPLEQRIGHLYFLLIYLAALVAGAVVTDLSQAREYLTVGASGATSGLLGALLFLGLFGKVPLSANFFVVNIGLNVVLAASNSRINWAAHLGGFTAGLIGCALLDLIERANRYTLRCKFPEFAKLNGFLIVSATALIIASTRSPIPFSPGWSLPGLTMLAVVTVVGIKAADLLLSMRAKGLQSLLRCWRSRMPAWSFWLPPPTPSRWRSCARSRPRRLKMPWLRPAPVQPCLRWVARSSH